MSVSKSTSTQTFKKVLMVKERSGFNFAVSEVDFFTRCNGTVYKADLLCVL